MSNRQIQPVRPQDYGLARQVRPRSLWTQIWTVALQPGYFFRTLPPSNDSRQWFWVGLLILGLIGLSAVRQEAALNPAVNTPAASIDFNSPPGTELGGGGSPFTTGPISSAPIPENSASSAPSLAGVSANEFSSSLTTALIAASHILLGWIILTILLSEIPLFNGIRPSFGQNLQVAIWTTVPLGLMAGLQVVYYAAGGNAGETGLSGLLSAWKPYNTLPNFPKSLMLSLAIRMTLFWIWSLILIYRGGRNTLDGKRWSVMLVVVAWAIVSIVTPVVTGAITAEAGPLTGIDTNDQGLQGNMNDLNSSSPEINSPPSTESVLPSQQPEQMQLSPLEVTKEAEKQATKIPPASTGTTIESDQGDISDIPITTPGS
jgi:Yip1-like protein